MLSRGLGCLARRCRRDPKGRGTPPGVCSILVAILAMIHLVADQAPAASKPWSHARARYFIAFLARPTEFGVDHAFVQVGHTSADGSEFVHSTIAFFPEGYPDIDHRTPLFDTRGSVRSVREDNSRNATAQHRVWVDAATFAKALAHGRWMRRHWRYYDLMTRNCNAVLFEFAERLGLTTHGSPTEQSSALVRALAQNNRDRSRTWKAPRHPTLGVAPSSAAA